ncbi:MAG: dockerin type I domain-containing protein, partial [Saprospiraceae bacterium]
MNYPFTQNSPIPKWLCVNSVYWKLIAIVYLVSLYGIQVQANPEDWPVYESNQFILDDKTAYTMAPLPCYGSIQLSLGQNGLAVVTPKMVISDNLPSYGQFKVLVLETGRTFVDCSDIGKSRSVKVTDTTTNNSCWAVLKVEDKLMPSLTCVNDTLLCTEDPFLVRYDALIDVFDNCDNNPKIDFGLSYQKLNCNTMFSSIMHVNYIVTDKYGNVALCNKDVYFQKIPLDSIVFPDNDTLYCPVINAFAGEPMYQGSPVSPLCDLLTSYRDDTLPVCGGMIKISRLWVVMDWCLRMSRMQRQEILISDTSRPIIICPKDSIIAANAQGCIANYKLPIATATDICSPSNSIIFYVRIDSSYNSRPGQTVSLGLGIHTLQYIAIDPCGNSDTCISHVTVEDRLAPSIVCPPKLILSLGGTGEVKINAAYLNKYVYYTDECGIDTVLIRRMNSNCNNPIDTTFRNEVTFCCNDLGTTQMIVFKVEDESGNSNFCMIEIQIQNKNVYSAICPLNKTVSCNTNIADLNITGKPIVTIVCNNYNITYRDSGQIDSCKRGLIKRKFFINFIGGPIDSNCVQYINVINNITTPIFLWARDTTISACTPDHPDSIKSKPKVLNDSCGLFKFVFKDSFLILPPDSCQKKLRIWSTLPVCGFGIYRDTQEIKFIDFYAPKLKGPKDSFHCVDNVNCSPFIKLQPLIISGCNTIKSIVNNINNGGADASGIYPLGKYTIIFTVIDGCNHVVKDTAILEVVDKISPIIGCRKVDRNIQINDSAKIIARDLLLPNYSDNCTPGPLLKISFDPNNANDTCRYISCTKHKQFPDSLWPFVVYVKDLSGNTASCTGRVDVDDPNGFCNNFTNKKISITGLIKASNNEPMSNVSVNEMKNKSFTLSSDIGRFNFSDIEPSTSIEVIPKYNMNWTEHLSTLDIIRIQKHILGVDIFTHPTEWIAADLNKDGRVTSLDISILRKLILGIINEVNTNTSWRF